MHGMLTVPEEFFRSFRNRSENEKRLYLDSIPLESKKRLESVLQELSGIITDLPNA